MILSVAACQNGQSPTDPCALFHPIYLDRKDILTINTERQILSHEETGRDLCDWPTTK